MNADDRRVVRYHSDEGVRAAIYLGEGTKYIHILPMDYPLQVKRIPLSDGKYLKDMDVHLSKALKTFRHAAKAWHGGLRNCSDAVRDALQEINK